VKVAILGANSHIAKGLARNFLLEGACELCLFTRSEARTREFLASIGQAPSGKCRVLEGYGKFLDEGFDLLLNCVGAGTPSKLGGDFSSWFTLTERFDNLCIESLKKSPGSTYVNFSSGAVYGREAGPATEDSCFKVRVNGIRREDYYAIAKLNAEAKHRSFEKLNIADLRIFAYFSRFIELNSGYFITEAISCALKGEPFKTGPSDMTRDYIHPDDLFRLVSLCAAKAPLNCAFDAVSARPASKFEMLELLKRKRGLRYEIDPTMKPSSPNGAADVYCSNFNRAASAGFKPAFGALEAIEAESDAIFETRRG